MFKDLNSALQKINNISKNVSDLNAIEQLSNGNITPIKRKIKNKIKNKLFNNF
jgi:hypothetical protein